MAKSPRGFDKAKNKAKKILEEGSKLKHLLSQSQEKANSNRSRLKEVWSEFQTLFRMLKAWKEKKYDQIPWRTIVYITAAIVYFLNPFDIIPDFIPFTGFIDDISILSFVINSIRSDIQKFIDWETTQGIDE